MYIYTFSLYTDICRIYDQDTGDAVAGYSARHFRLVHGMSLSGQQMPREDGASQGQGRDVGGIFRGFPWEKMGKSSLVIWVWQWFDGIQWDFIGFNGIEWDLPSGNMGLLWFLYGFLRDVFMG